MNLSNEQAERLEKTGKLVFRMDELRRVEPQRARVVEEYNREVETLVDPTFRATGAAPKEVGFVRKAPGAYVLTVDGVPRLLVSDASPTQ